jgi:hypothetical protein
MDIKILKCFVILFKRIESPGILIAALVIGKTKLDRIFRCRGILQQQGVVAPSLLVPVGIAKKALIIINKGGVGRPLQRNSHEGKILPGLMDHDAVQVRFVWMLQHLPRSSHLDRKHGFYPGCHRKS